ncbi:protein lethal(2)essential for life [Cephus cinctus]|uniref:Protein lethal(2)essential for life n=1 Tax=Cephus cinctus TaxID=211228 RepID=A0AAJ7FUY4_CEPCN|nr:protein lethal(2)essential for life [Cephus cinctus]
MSLLPLLFSNWWEDLEHPHRLLNQDFGHGINPADIVMPSLVPMHYGLPHHDRGHIIPRCPSVGYHRSCCGPIIQPKGGFSTVKADKNKFEVNLDVQQFTPEEIKVKVVDKSVIVEGKHKEKQDEHGWISREFIRKYLIPEQCDIEQVASKLSSDGVLSITVPRKDKPQIEGERVIAIEHTGKPAVLEKPVVNDTQQNGEK